MTKLTSLNSIHDLRRWILITTGKARLRAQFVDGIPGPYTSADCLFIPTFNAAMTEEDEIKLRGFVLHECLHHTEGPDIFKIGTQYKLTVKHPLGAITNLLEDQRIEQAGASRYKGDEVIISDLREWMTRDAVEFIQRIAKDGHQLTPDSCKMQSVFNAAAVAQAKWCAGVALHVKDQLRAMSAFPEVIEYDNKLHRGINVIDAINNLKDEYQSFDLAKKIYGLLWDKTEKEVQEELEQMIKGEGKGGEGEEGECGSGGDGKEKGEGEGAEKKKGTSKKGDGKKDKGEVDPRTGKYRIPFEWYVKSEHGDSGTGHGLGLDYTNHTMRKTFTPDPFDAMHITDYTKHPPGRTGNLRSWGDGGKIEASSAFANRVRRYLQVRSAALYIGGQTRGNIHSRALYRAGVPQVGSGEWNKRVFRQKHEDKLLDTSVSLLVDMSGSMSGCKVVHATKAAMILNHVISNVLRVNTEILTFTFDSHTHMGIVKPFGTRASDDQIYDRFDAETDKMWGNADADAILFTYDRLLKQTTKRKVMVVLSDGSPADGIDGTDCYYALKTTVQQIEQAKRCDIIGIGIMDMNVRDFYSKHAVIADASQLEDQLLKVITGNILNGSNANV